MKKTIAIVSLFLIMIFGFAFTFTGVVSSEITKQALNVYHSHDAFNRQPRASAETVSEAQSQIKTVTIAQQSRQVTQPKTQLNPSPRQFNINQFKQQVQAERRKRKPAIIKERYKKRIREIVPKNPIAPIVLPLFFQRLEEKAQAPLPVSQYKKPKRQAMIEAQAQLNMMAKPFRELPQSFKEKHFHPRYVNLAPGQRLESLQLGRDLLQAFNPNYQNIIHQAVLDAFPANGPKFQWNPAAAQPAAMHLKAGTQTQGLPLKQAQPKRMRDLKHLIRNLRKGPSRVTQGQLERAPQWSQFDIKHAPPSQVHQAVIDKLNLPADVVPNLNSEHHLKKYYRYYVYLDSFYCKNQDEWVNDEPYWHITSSVPRFDPDDMDFVYWLSAGELYNTRSRVTGSYSIDEKEERGFRPEDRKVLRDNIFNTSTTFTIGLWEEDWSKGKTKEALENQIREIRNQLINDIKKAVLDALGDALMASLMDLFPEVKTLISAFFNGNLPFADLMSAVQQIYGSVDTGWLALELIFSGKSAAELLQGWAGACWQCTVAILALKVAGPIVIDLLEGDFEDALKGFLMIPYRLFATIINLFLGIIEFFENLMAWLDPDDYIDTLAVTIDGSFDDIFEDADWGLGPRNYVQIRVEQAEQYHREHGYGPTAENSDLVKGGFFYQPALKFQRFFNYREFCERLGWDGQDPAQCKNLLRMFYGRNINDIDERRITVDYTAYYNVKRRLEGGRETFGYTVTPDDTTQYRTYTAKSHAGRKIKVSVVALNSAEVVPIVNVYNPKRSSAANSNAYSENIREFYVDAYPGEEYEVQIFKNPLFQGSLYGYVTLEEKQTPEDLRSIEAYNFPNYYIRHRNFLGEISPLESTLDKKDGTFRIVPGLAAEEHFSFESINFPGYFLWAEDTNSQLRLKRLIGGTGTGRVRDYLDDIIDEGRPEGTHPAARTASSDSDLKEYWKSATFVLDDGFAGVGGLSFRCVKKFSPLGDYIRHKNFKLFLEPYRGSNAQFKKDATFYLRRGKWPEIP
jgi:hypothetical protein